MKHDHQHSRRRLSRRKRKLVLHALSLGADRQLAAHRVGMSLAELRLRVRGDRVFRDKMRRREAECELHYLTLLRRAAERKGGERIAMWWLERRAPDRFGERRATSVSPAQLDAICEELIDGLQQDVASEADRARIIDRLSQLSGIARGAVRELEVEVFQNESRNIR